MNAAPNPPAETALQKERRLFREIFDRLINTLLNWIFDLRPERAQRRARNLVILFILSGAVICLIYYPLGTWARYIQNLLLYLLNPAYAAGFEGALVNPLTEFMNFFVAVFTDAHILQYLPIFIAPFFIAQQLAAFYLADIFELEDIAVARHFVSEVAFTGSDETIRISKGKIHEEHLKSSNYLIGGPGKVIVDLDSAALFEHADGTPHVIGPTGKDPGGKATIDGFERLREAIDIRDHQVELRDQNTKSPSVKSRSLDGIPITATDVSLMFSVDRGENPQPSAEFPYPFNKEAVERIVYQSGSRVAPERLYPSEYVFNWINNMIGLIRGRLGGFMSERNLTEYLASIGQPEVEKSKEREELIDRQVRRLTQPDETSDPKTPKPAPPFTPRYKITDLFSQFASDFTKNARSRGVILHWIGIGTWQAPPEITVVPENHLEAWTVSQKNLREGSEGAMKKAENEATLKKMEDLIRSVPIGAYHEIAGMGKQYGRKSGKKKDRFFEKYNLDDLIFHEDEISDLMDEERRPIDITRSINQRILAAADQAPRDSDQRDNIRNLLLEYRKQLLEAVQFVSAKGEEAPASVREAVNYINQQMGFKHWAGKP